MIEQSVNKVMRELDTEAWFDAVGEPITEGEEQEARDYLNGLGLDKCRVATVDTWLSARDSADNPNWDHVWWDKELNEQRELYKKLSTQYQEVEILDALTKITDRATNVFYGPAAIAAARTGVADQGLNRAAAGAASQSCYQYALALMSGVSSNHFFCCKFRLFLAGRWPLSVVDNTFYIF